ncbi:MAG: DNA polymerase III subunit delta, partial [Gammaproteobacteria bacterium]|nr:DNA polymerase III subunit delta [Gammaproteobacteria bacterium]
MKLNPEELATQLAQGIKPVYLITGDEPYQCLDLVRQVRQATTAAGYGTRESYQVDAGFDWAPVQVSTTNLSLFAERKLIELRVNSMKAFKSGESILKDYTQHPSDDTVLLISLPRLEKRVKSQAWFSALEKMGVVIEVWPLERKQFVPWLRRHVRQEAMTIENDALETLADFVEGNLLAASQEISKLKALGLNHIDNKILLEQVSNSSKFGTEALLDACFGGDLERTVRILGSLGEAKEAQPLL